MKYNTLSPEKYYSLDAIKWLSVSPLIETYYYKQSYDKTPENCFKTVTRIETKL